MPAAARVDCVVVGHNDIDFETFAAQQRALAPHSGAYHEVKANSVVLHGKRFPYMELVNHGIEQATGRNPRYDIFDAPSLGVCWLQSFLEQRDFIVERINSFHGEKARFRQLLAHSPRAVAITTTFYCDGAPIEEIVRFVRVHCPETRIILGGPHVYDLATHLDARAQQTIFREMGGDIYIVEAQGEATLARVLERLRNGESLREVPNLVLPGAGSPWRTGREAENNDLDQNRVRWERFDPTFVAPLAYVRTSRGCQFACTFCNFPLMAGSHVLSSLESLRDELDALRAAGTRYIAFVDDTFNVPLPRFKQLLRMMIDNGYGFRWASFLRCSNLDETALDLMQESGCLAVFLGLESGDQRVLDLMHKAATLEGYRWGMEQLHRRGIVTFASMICGFPGETAASVENTIAFVQETAPTFFNVQLYYHDRSTPIQRRAAELGIRGGGYSWSHDSMTWREAARWATAMIEQVHSSLPIPVHAFSLWAIPYLVSKGISRSQIEDLARITRPLLLASLHEAEGDTATYEASLASLFRETADSGGLARRPQALIRSS